MLGLLAILKSGNCYVPIDPQYPDERIEYILEATNFALLLTSEKYLKKYHNLNTLELSLKGDLKENINKSNVNNNAYIIFTSGTTGKPKGVEVIHKSIINTLLWRKNCYNFDSNTVTLQLPSFSFDSSVEDIFTSLISGSCLCLPECKINEVSILIETIKKHNVTHFLITPALYKAFLESNPTDISSLDFITVAGEAFNIDLVKKHFEVFPNARLFNEYGPTENSVCSTVYEFSKDSTAICIGKPITNTFAYIVANNSTLLPVGVAGELLLGGNGIVKGYLNNPDLTNQKFIKNPFGDGIVYKTGDLARWLPDGNIDFIGRIDNQVKVRGFRIELNEIDANILTFPSVKQSFSALKEINNTKFICSYIVSETSVNTKELKEYLSEKMASHMIPTYVMQLDKLPLNINGKVDKNKLPIPSISRNNDDIVLARNDTDKIILNMLKDLFGFESVSIDDNLFDIGIDSLSCITLANSISNKLEITITVKDIFDNTTVQDLSDYISKLDNSVSSSTITKAIACDYYPLSSAQKRIYYASSMNNSSTLYNTSGGIILDKALDVNLLKDCFNTLISRHEALRTHFEIKDDDIVQIIDDSANFTLHTETQNGSDLNSIYTDFVKPFDLSKAPLLRAKVVNLNAGKMLLLLDMHHIICDGMSLDIFLKELCELYNGNALPEKEIDYKDFTLWEKDQFKKDSFKKAKDFWLNQFSDEIPLLNMPTVFPRPSTQSFEGNNYRITLSKEISQKIFKTAKALKVTPYMLMLSVYYILLSKYSSQDDIVVGTPTVGRESASLTNMVGMFVNTLALRNKVNCVESFRDFVTNVKSLCLSAFENQVYPFDELVKDLNIKKDISRNPILM